jgi:two-component system chemotaxis response regulator CheY
MKVLIVEDDFTSRHLMQSIISKYGNYQIAVNGIEALELFKLAIDEGEKFNLVCMDINMPEMDGQEALKKIREIEAEYGIEGLDRTNIIMTTAYSNYENITKAFDEQCDGYLVKPIEMEKLIKILKNLEI